MNEILTSFLSILLVLDISSRLRIVRTFFQHSIYLRPMRYSLRRLEVALVLQNKSSIKSTKPIPLYICFKVMRDCQRYKGWNLLEKDRPLTWEEVEQFVEENNLIASVYNAISGDNSNT